jgi:hypothetical protein
VASPCACSCPAPSFAVDSRRRQWAVSNSDEYQLGPCDPAGRTALNDAAITHVGRSWTNSEDPAADDIAIIAIQVPPATPRSER